MRVEYKISESDSFEAQVTHGGRWTKLMPLLGLLLITAGVISLAENPARYANSILPILAGLFFLFGLRALARRHTGGTTGFSRLSKLLFLIPALMCPVVQRLQDTRGRLLFGIKRVRTFSDLPSAEGL